MVLLDAGGPAAVYWQGDTRNPGGVVRSQKDTSQTDIPRQTKTGQRRPPTRLFDLFPCQVILDGCLNVPWTDCVGRDSIRGQLESRVASQIDDASLGRRIGRTAPPPKAWTEAMLIIRPAFDSLR